MISLLWASRRAAALDSAYELLLVLAGMAGACCVVLVLGIRKIPRQHWPRLKFGAAPGTPTSSPALES
jgi:hypothetical protein